MPVTSTFQNTTGTQSGQQTGSSTTQAQSPALTAQQNLSALPDLASLTSLINSINQNAQVSANAARLPGGAGLLQQQSQNIRTGLAGQLDPGVVAMLQQQGAELGAGRGMGPGAPSTNAAYLRALGLTATQRQDTASQQLNSALSANPVAPLFNPSQFLLTPAQAGTTTTTQGANTGQNTSQSSGSTVYPDQPAPVSLPSGGGTRPATPAADTSWLDSLFGTGGGQGGGSTTFWQPPSTSTGSSSNLDWLLGPVNPNWSDTSSLGLPVEDLVGPVNPDYGDGGSTVSGLAPGVSPSEFDSLFSEYG